MVEHRLKNILHILRHQTGNGCDIHTVGNMQNTAKMTLELLKLQYIDEEKALDITKRLEQKLVEFLRQRYPKT